MWARVIDDAPAEPMDGCFVHSRGRRAPGARHLRLRPEREGFSAVETAGPRPRALERPDGTPAVLAGARRRPGGRACTRIVGGEELLELGWRTRALANALSVSRPMTDAVRSFMDKKAVAQVLEQIAAFLELKGENPFRIRAFRTAARAVGSFPGDLREGLEDGSLAGHQGRRSRHPADRRPRSSTTGRASLLEELREQIPPGLVEMLAISGPRRRQDPPDPRRARHRFAARARGGGARWPAGHAAPLRAQDLARTSSRASPTCARRAPSGCCITPPTRRKACAPRWSGCPACCRRSSPGDVRRRAEVVRDLVLVLVAEVAPGELFKRLSQLPGVHEFAGQDDRRLTLRFAGRGERADRGDDAGEHRRRAGAGHRQRGAPARRSPPTRRPANFALTGAALWRGSAFVPTPDEADLL